MTMKMTTALRVADRLLVRTRAGHSAGGLTMASLALGQAGPRHHHLQRHGQQDRISPASMRRPRSPPFGGAAWSSGADAAEPARIVLSITAQPPLANGSARRAVQADRARCANRFTARNASAARRGAAAGAGSRRSSDAARTPRPPPPDRCASIALANTTAPSSWPHFDASIVIIALPSDSSTASTSTRCRAATPAAVDDHRLPLIQARAHGEPRQLQRHVRQPDVLRPGLHHLHRRVDLLLSFNRTGKQRALWLIGGGSCR